MSRAMKNKAQTSNDENGFPAEAYEYHDDVTIEAVEIMRKKAAGTLAGKTLKVVDGYDFSSAK